MRSLILLSVLSATIFICSNNSWAKDRRYGSWWVITKRDRFTGGTSVYAYTTAKRQVRLNFGRSLADLWLRCEDAGEIEAFVDFGTFYECSDSEIGLRADNDSTITWAWTASTDCHAAFWPQTGETLSLLEYLTHKRRLLMRAYPYTGGSATVEFRMNGIARALKALKLACPSGETDQVEGLSFDDGASDTSTE